MSLRSPSVSLFCVLLCLGLFTNSDAQNFKYQPIIYAPGDNLSTPFHAWLVFDHPEVTEFQFLNVRVTNPDNGQGVWAVKNLPIPDFATPREIHYRMALHELALTEPVLPLMIEIEWAIGEYQLDDTFVAIGPDSLLAEPVPHYVPTSSPRLIHNYIPYFPPLIIEPIFPLEVVGFTRECNVPNIDLDSLAHPDPVTGDINSCAPAAAANSLKWLMDVHPEIPVIDSLRGLLDTLKLLMKKDSVGVAWMDFIAGKLAFADKHMLPIRVKYQVHTPTPAFKPTIPSPDSTYGHAAENETGATGIPDFDWICNELNDGEDVEMGIGYWCDSMGVRVQRTGHSVNLTGYFKFGNDMWFTWKHDTWQRGPDGMVEEFGRWCIDSVGYPFLKEMSETDTGCIAYVGDVVSESYDPGILFTELLPWDYSYDPISYMPGSLLDYSHHAYITYRVPSGVDSQYVNLIVKNPETGLEEWLVRNMIMPDASWPERVKLDLAPICDTFPMPSEILLKFNIGDYQTSSDFNEQGILTLPANPIESYIPDGVYIGYHPGFPDFAPEPFTPIPPLNVKKLFRGCEVPNIDLDTMAYPIDPDDPTSTDHLACGPAAAANSMQWLDDVHDEIDIPGNTRSILDTLKKRMMLNQRLDSAQQDTTGVDWIKFIQGKLDFIDEYKLPIRVKFQSHFALEDIASPNRIYGHTADNQSPPNPNPPPPMLHPQFDWLAQELEEGEDVEMMLGFYCTEEIPYMAGDTLDGVVLEKDTIVVRRFRGGGHYINVTGYADLGHQKMITYKHDVDQRAPGGTSPENEPDDIPSTDRSEWLQDTAGYAYLPSESGGNCRAYVETIVSESFDSTVLFCPVKVCIPDDNGEGSLRDALLCAEPGAVVTLGIDIANDTISITSGPLVIDRDITLVGDPGDNIYIKGESVDRVFEITPGTSVTFDGIQIICGEGASGACVYNEGTLVLRDSKFFNHDGVVSTASQILNEGEIRVEENVKLKRD